MAIAAIAMIGFVGLSIDVGRIYITKNEMQSYADSAALSAGLALDGTTAGVTSARNAVANSTNTWNFDTAAVSDPVVTFAKAKVGPWIANPSPASGYSYVKVTAVAPLNLYFIPAVISQTKQSVNSMAVAGQIPIGSFSEGIAPYTAVSVNTTGPDFGLVVGNAYALQWPQFNNNRNGCGPANPSRCFNSPPCAGDSTASQIAVVSNWSSNISGYWGGASNTQIEQEILDLIQLQSVAVGTNILPIMTNGNKASEAGYLDERAGQDTNLSDNTVAAYLAAAHNGRRLIPVLIVNPVDPTHTTVTGYGQFLLFANGSRTNYYQHTTNGNDPYCAIYAGTYNVGSSNPGAGSATGASIAKLVQ